MQFQARLPFLTCRLELTVQYEVSTKADAVDVGRASIGNEANSIDLDSIGRAYGRSSADAMELETTDPDPDYNHGPACCRT